MGIYAEYLDRKMSFPALTEERKTQLARIASIRECDVLVYAADLRKGTAPIAIQYEDLLPFTDQLSNLAGSAIDVILETPGGYAEITEDMVRLLRSGLSTEQLIYCGRAAGWLLIPTLEPG